MKDSMNKIFRFSALMAAFLVAGSADAVGPQNSRAAVAGNIAPARAAGRDVKRGDVSGTPRAMAARTTTTSRAAATPTVASRAGTVTASRNARNAKTISRSATTMARSARSAVAPVRSAVNVARTGVSRAQMSRATAVFDDVSKIGGGYAQCREAYATCMDQFCAKANDTYRRCFCSDRFTGFRDTEDALDQAKVLLQQFEDNNLNAVDKTAAEVDAMYSATVGEAAIKNDTSGAAKLLAEIGDLISGKKKASNSSSSTSLGVMSLDFSTDIGDVWGGSSSSIFGGANEVDFASLEGGDLFTQVHKQCAEMVADNCPSGAVANMAKSAYGIMITQDCNAYERSIDAKRQQVQNTVRQAEKILREARLEEYRAHNSQDVNECLDKVRSAMLADTACGANYKRCLDPTGAFINQTTGEPIYTARLFQLADLINLDGQSADVLGQNDTFAKFLDERKMFATTALDSCRDISDLVWTEFKRAALIEISQAQEEKLESVRMSCVSTMKECYDTQSGALKDFDDTTSKAAGAISAYAAKAMCKDKVVACAALYGNGTENSACEFDGSGRISNGATCGLTALLSFVDNVDNTRVAEGCEEAIDAYVEELCTPESGEMGYPWKCRKLGLNTNGVFVDSYDGSNPGKNLAKTLVAYAITNCSDPTKTEKTYGNLATTVRQKLQVSVEDVVDDLESQMSTMCEDLEGIWYSDGAKGFEEMTNWLPAFTKVAFGGETPNKDDFGGICVENTAYVQCLASNTEGETPIATWNDSSQTCTLSDTWYKQQCSMLGGYFENNMCYVAKTNSGE